MYEFKMGESDNLMWYIIGKKILATAMCFIQLINKIQAFFLKV